MVADRVWMGVTKGVATGAIALIKNCEFPYSSWLPSRPFPHLCLYHMREGWHRVDLALHSTGNFGDRAISWGCDGGWMTLGFHCR